MWYGFAIVQKEFLGYEFDDISLTFLTGNIKRSNSFGFLFDIISKINLNCTDLPVAAALCKGVLPSASLGFAFMGPILAKINSQILTWDWAAK